MILVTTSDYFPQLGGLSTFTENIIQSLKNLGEEVEVFHWKKPSDIQSFNFNRVNNYKLIINIHVMFCWLAPNGQDKMINFIHGSEILMTSPNPLKRIYKKFLKENFFNKMNSSYLNLFISNTTLKKIKEIGYSSHVSRDIVFHNCIDLKGASYIEKPLYSEVSFSCIVRNVPHKNLDGAIRFCEKYSLTTNRDVSLIIPYGIDKKSNKIKIANLIDKSDQSREEAYKKSHFNLLLSLDHSTKGFFEGFGLTVLEAAKYGCPSIANNSGGLPEATHQNLTGFVIDVDNASSWDIIFSQSNDDYLKMRMSAFMHNLENHGLNQYEFFFARILNKNWKVA